jgi:GntP family gluconate:H+ symporter
MTTSTATFVFHPLFSSLIAVVPQVHAGPSQLLTALVVSVAVIVVLISWLKLHPFLALTLGSLVLALGVGTPLQDSFTSFGSGFGSTTTSVGVLIALGAMLGKLLSDSGGTDRIVQTILSHTSPRWLPWAMALIAFLIGIPLFFEGGLVLLIPVIILVARRSGQSLIRVGIPALAGLSVLHGLVPPHPGPLIAISALHANLGLTLALGILIAVPTVIISGPLLSGPMARWVHAEAPAGLVSEFESSSHREHQPSFVNALTSILLPVVLMLGKTVADTSLSAGSQLRIALDVLGSPMVALLLATLISMFTLGRGAGMSRKELSSAVGNSLPGIAGILLIVGAGGGFKQTIVDTGVAQVISQVAQQWSISALLFGWLLAVLIRLATGSATVATITASGILAPLAASLDPVHTALLVLAVGAGSLFFSHVNDAGFWLVKEYFGMSVGQTLRTWSVMETVISVIALIFVLLLGAVL